MIKHEFAIHPTKKQIETTEDLESIRAWIPISKELFMSATKITDADYKEAANRMSKSGVFLASENWGSITGMYRITYTPDLPTVDIIASGYEWTCPNCDEFNREIEVTETVTCSHPGCESEFETNPAEHARKG